MTRAHVAAVLERAKVPILAVAGLAAAVGAVHVLRRVVLTLLHPRMVHETLEGAAYLSMAAWRDGGWSAMYPTSYEEPGTPLVITPYPPLFHILWWVTSVLSGGTASYTPGRIIANLALIGIVLAIYACARRAGAGRLISTVFSLLFLVPVPVAVWAGVARVDVPGIAFALAGLWVYLRYRDDYASRRYLLSAVPIVLAGLTKQSLIAVPAAILFAELVARRYRRAAVFAAVTAGPVLGVFLVLNVMTNGGFFDATVTSLADEIFIMAGVAVAVDFLITNPMTLMLLLLAVSLIRVGNRGDTVLGLAAIVAYVLLALTIGKPGSNVNYFIEPLAAFCICGAVALERWQQRRRPVGAMITVAVSAVVVWSVSSLVPGYREAYRAERAGLERAETIHLPPEASTGPVLVPPSLALLVSPRPVYYLNDAYTVGVLAAWDKLISMERIAGDLRNQRISAVLVRPDAFQQRGDGPSFVGDWRRGWNFWSIDEFRTALLDAYEPLDERYPLGVVVLVPKIRDAVGAGPAEPSP